MIKSSKAVISFIGRAYDQTNIQVGDQFYIPIPINVPLIKEMVYSQVYQQVRLRVRDQIWHQVQDEI